MCIVGRLGNAHPTPKVSPTPPRHRCHSTAGARAPRRPAFFAPAAPPRRPPPQHSGSRERWRAARATTAAPTPTRTPPRGARTRWSRGCGAPSRRTAARWSSTSTSSETPERERRERGRGGSEGRRVGGRGSETEAAGKQRTRESASGSAVDGTARNRCRSGCMPPRSWRGGEAREQQNSPPATQVEIGESLGTTCGGKGTAVGAAVGRLEGGAPKCHARAAGLGARARVAARQTPPRRAAADQYRGVGQCARSTARGGCARGSAGSRALGGSSR